MWRTDHTLSRRCPCLRGLDSAPTASRSMSVHPIATQPAEEQPLPTATPVPSDENGRIVTVITITKPNPDAELGLVMTTGVSPKVLSFTPGPNLAAAAGFEVGDEILSVNGMPADTDATAAQAMKQATDTVAISVARRVDPVTVHPCCGKPPPGASYEWWPEVEDECSCYWKSDDPRVCVRTYTKAGKQGCHANLGNCCGKLICIGMIFLIPLKICGGG